MEESCLRWFPSWTSSTSLHPIFSSSAEIWAILSSLSGSTVYQCKEKSDKQTNEQLQQEAIWEGKCPTSTKLLSTNPPPTMLSIHVEKINPWQK